MTAVLVCVGGDEPMLGYWGGAEEPVVGVLLGGA